MKISKNFIINTILLVIYCAITIFTVIHHEVWRDEAQVWLVARDLNLFEMIDHVRFEGHPIMWYLMVLPFAKAGLGVISMQFLSLFFMIAAAGVFLYKSPFNVVTKITVLFSAGMVYWLSSISRSYSLIPLLVFLLAVFYPKQKEKPYFYAVILALLSQTHVLMCAFCSCLIGLFFIENIVKNKENRKTYVPPFFIMFLPVLILTVYIFSSPIQNTSLETFNELGQKSLWLSFSSLLVNLYGLLSNFKGTFISLVLIMTSACLFVEDKKLFFVYITSFLYQLLIYTYIWLSSPEKASLFLISLVFCWWAVFDTKKLNNTKKVVYNLFLIIIFGASLPIARIVAANDIKYDYSGSKRTAEFIEQNISKDDVIVTNDPVFTSSIAAYLFGREFYYEPEQAFYTFGYDLRKKEQIDLSKTSKGKKYYLYSTINISNVPMVYQSKPETLIMTETFYITEKKL